MILQNLQNYFKLVMFTNKCLAILLNGLLLDVMQFLQVKLTQGNLTFMPTQDSVASQQELIVASELYVSLDLSVAC